MISHLHSWRKVLTRQHPAGRVARSADSRSSYSVPLEPQSTVHKLFNIPPIYLDWTLSNQPPAKIEPRRHETQPSRRTPPSRNSTYPPAIEPHWPNSTQPPAIEPRRDQTQPFEEEWVAMVISSMDPYSPSSPSWHLSRNVQNTMIDTGKCIVPTYCVSHPNVAFVMQNSINPEVFENLK